MTAPVPVHENRPTRAFLASARSSHRALDPDTPAHDRFRSWFPRTLLSRPAILDAEQTRSLDRDLPLVLRALHSLPSRLFDGDEKAFTRALGWIQPAVPPLLAALSGPTIPLGRADLVRSPGGFRMVEFNTSSSLGSFEFGELCRAVLADPHFRKFAEEEGLYYVDPLACMADTLLATAGAGRGDRPTVALVHWTTSPVAVDASLFSDLFTELGFRLVNCTVADLEYGAGGLTAHGTKVDVVYRTFLLKTVAADPAALDLLAPLIAAVRDDAVGLFSPLNADLYGTKAAMAMLSEPAGRQLLPPDERGAVERLLPWTRSLRDARTREEGQGSLLEHVLAHRGDLVLKPSVGHAGQGVRAGWMCSNEEWRGLVREALGGDFIVQSRAPSVAERFFPPGGPEPASTCFLHWGLFVTKAGLSGGFVKGLLDQEQDIRFLGDGSRVGCVFHAADPSLATLHESST